jgi:hypothetical protein
MVKLSEVRTCTPFLLLGFPILSVRLADKAVEHVDLAEE